MCLVLICLEAPHSSGNGSNLEREREAEILGSNFYIFDYLYIFES